MQVIHRVPPYDLERQEIPGTQVVLCCLLCGLMFGVKVVKV